METVTASLTWGGPDDDVLRVFVEPTPEPWGVADFEGDVSLLRALDDRAQATGPLAGVEIAAFLQFDQWGDLPRDPLWQIPGWEPLPLDVLLKREQAILRGRARRQGDAT